MDILGISLNSLDLLLVLILFVGVLVGMIRGTLTQIISMVSIWLGVVATLWLYKPFSNYIIQDGLSIGAAGGDTLAFMTLIIVFFNGFRLLVKYLATPPEERKRGGKRDADDPLALAAKSTAERMAGFINAFGGMVMGFLLTTLWLALLLGVLQFILQPTVADIPYTGFLKGLVINLRTSTLRPWFNQVLWGLSQSVTLFIPKDATIFKVVLQTLLSSPG